MEYNIYAGGELAGEFSERAPHRGDLGEIDMSERNEDGLRALRQHPLVARINAWMTTPLYVMTIMLLAVIGYVCSMEIAVYTVYMFIGLYLSLLGEDYLPVMPMVFACYIIPSAKNNPGMSEGSIFYPENGGVFILTIAALFAISILARLCTDRELGGIRFLKSQRKLLPGLLAVGAAYLLAGTGSGHYFDKGLQNLLFGGIQFVALAFVYWFFAGAVRWERVRTDYFVWMGFGYGLVILCEILHIYLTGNLVRPDGVIEIGKISSGWGNANNIGAMIAMTVPFAFYLSCREKHGWIYNFCASMLLVGVVLTSSRTAILGAGFAYGCAFLMSVRRSRLDGNRGNLIAHALTVLAVIAVIVVFWDKLLRLFTIMIDKGFDSSRRDTLYVAGIKQWLKYPIFGGTFYPIDYRPEEWSEVAAFTAFFPPRWHNTLVQLAACCGTVGLAAYGWHRFQTIRLWWGRNDQSHVVCIGLSVLSLLLMSLLDCHMYNIGPALFYSMALAFLEKCPDTK